MKYFKIIKLFILLSIVSCSYGEYKKPSLGWYNGLDGYFEKEINKNTFILEYNNTSIGGGSYKKHDEVTAKFWEQRAKELCPRGYTGTHEMIYRSQSKLEVLKSDAMGFNELKIASGVIKCAE